MPPTYVKAYFRRQKNDAISLRPAPRCRFQGRAEEPMDLRLVVDDQEAGKMR